MVRVLGIFKAIAPLVPEVASPDKNRPPTFQDKLIWTGVALLLYLLASQIPLWGIVTSSSDPFYWMRHMMASNKGSLMELGISPIVTSGMIMQFLVALQVIEYDQTKEAERQLYQTFSKFVGIVFTVLQATLYVMVGSYGPWRELGMARAAIIIGQLSLSGLLVTFLDDMLTAGWGIGSGMNLFIASNICDSIFWRAFSLQSFNYGRGSETEGAVFALIQQLLTKADKMRALKTAFFRPGPNLMSLMSTALVFLLVIFFQGFRIDVPLVHTRSKQRSSYPIKLFYTSTTPIMLQNSITTNLFFLSQMLHKSYPANLVVRALGVWEVQPNGGSLAQSGLAYYLSPPFSMAEIAADPVHFVVYTAYMLTVCGLLSALWVGMGGQSAAEVSRQVRSQGMTIPGFRDDGTQKYFERYIPIAARVGGVCLGMLAIVADLLGAVGSGSGILMVVGILGTLQEAFVREIKMSGSFAEALQSTGMPQGQRQR